MKFLSANGIASDGIPRSEASNLGLYCLPISYKINRHLVYKDISQVFVQVGALEQVYPQPMF